MRDSFVFQELKQRSTPESVVALVNEVLSMCGYQELEMCMLEKATEVRDENSGLSDFLIAASERWEEVVDSKTE